MEDLIKLIVGVIILLFWIFGKQILSRRDEERPAPPERQPAPGSEDEAGDPFEALRRRIEDAARRRQQEEEARKRGESVPFPSEPGEQATRPQQQPPPWPAPVPQPPARRPAPAPQPASRRVQLTIAPPEPIPARPLAASEGRADVLMSAPPQVKQALTGWARIGRLPPMQRAIIMAEILGPPNAMS